MRKELKPAGEIIKLNALLSEYARSARIPYVDYHSVLRDERDGLPEKYAPDGVHPNKECYGIMERMLKGYLKKSWQALSQKSI